MGIKVARQWELFYNINMKLCGIYIIKNKINNSIYVGQSKNIFHRWIHHKSLLKNNCHNNPHLQHSWNKYGEQAFEFSIIELCSKQQLNEKEIYWANKYKGNLLNVKKCGTQNYILTAETKSKISNARKGHIVSKETRDKISNTQKGKKLKEETKRKMSMARKGHKVSAKTKNKISMAHKGKHLNPDTEFPKKKVILDGEMIFESLNECGRYLNVQSGTVHRAIKKQYKCKGHTITYYGG